MGRRRWSRLVLPGQERRCITSRRHFNHDRVVAAACLVILSQASSHVWRVSADVVVHLGVIPRLEDMNPKDDFPQLGAPSCERFFYDEAQKSGSDIRIGKIPACKDLFEL